MDAAASTKAATWIAQMEALFKACADQTRLRILHLLASEGEICVCHLVDVLQTNQPKVSRHLAYLKRVGLVADRKEGLWVYYRLATPQAAQADRVLNCWQSCCVAVPEMQQDRLRLQAVRASEPAVKLRAISAPAVSAEEAEERSELQIELL